MNITHQRIKFIVVILISLIGLSGVKAQEVLPAAGGKASGNGGSISYTIGQMAYTLDSGTSGSVSQGVQQPYEIMVVTGVDERLGIELTMKVYPNPTTDFLTLHHNNSDLSELAYQLCDMNGRLLESKILESSETTISMSRYAPSAYFLKVIQNNKEIKTFKIIKK